MLGLILLVAAFVLFFIASIWPFWGAPDGPHRFSLVAGGLACATLAYLLAGHPIS